MSKKNITLKKWHLIAFGIVILAALSYNAYQAWYWPKAMLDVGGKSITVLVANTVAHRYEGWSNKKNMGNYGGMLFLFPEYGRQPMVMRQMSFPLDMVWLKDGRVVDMAPNVQPEPGVTENLLNLYMSSQPANAVLELPAGYIANTGLKIGDRVAAVKD